MSSVPPKVRLPVTLTRSLPVGPLPPATPGVLSSKRETEPAANTRPPSVSVPGLWPGASVPPFCTVTNPLIVPTPASVALVWTATAPFKLPSTTSIPPATVVPPV